MTADTGSPLRPGLFQGSVDAVQAWAKYINANGGLACRKVVVKAADSKLTADDAQNAVTTACSDSVALVGTTALFLDNMKRGRELQGQDRQAHRHPRPRGDPDLPGRAVLADLVRGVAHRRRVPVQRYGGAPRSSEQTVTPNYYFKKYGKDALHGVYLVPSDLPSTISSSTPLFATDEQLGHQGGRASSASAA